MGAILDKEVLLDFIDELQGDLNEIRSRMQAITDLCIYYGDYSNLDVRGMQDRAFDTMQALAESTEAEIDGLSDKYAKFHSGTRGTATV